MLRKRSGIIDFVAKGNQTWRRHLWVTWVKNIHRCMKGGLRFKNPRCQQLIGSKKMERKTTEIFNNRNASSSSATWNRLISMSGFPGFSCQDSWLHIWLQSTSQCRRGRRKLGDCTQVMRLQNKPGQSPVHSHGSRRGVSTPHGTCV